jgi:hypothetical protein
VSHAGINIHPVRVEIHPQGPWQSIPHGVAVVDWRVPCGMFNEVFSARRSRFDQYLKEGRAAK